MYIGFATILGDLMKYAFGLQEFIILRRRLYAVRILFIALLEHTTSGKTQ